MEQISQLVKRYKKQTPKVNPFWDVTKNSIEYNDINDSIIDAGLEIYIAPFGDVWAGIYEPGIYDCDTLWKSNVHNPQKIAKVIYAWGEGQLLSPIFLVKHESQSMALVADGKHRLTVARYMGCECIPFMVQANCNEWVLIAIPSAKKI